VWFKGSFIGNVWVTILIPKNPVTLAYYLERMKYRCRLCFYSCSRTW